MHTPNSTSFAEPAKSLVEDGIDLKLPISELMRVGTSAAHTKAESNPAVNKIIGGHMEPHEYVRYLMMLWHVYNAMEIALEEHANHPVLAPTYNPTLLSRTNTLSSDIAHFLEVSPDVLTTHPTWVNFLASLPPAVTNYVNCIRTVAATSPELLLAHTYVRYLGDLSGGQFIRLRMVKTFKLDNSGKGVQFYDFGTLGGGPLREGERAGMGELKKVKEWFRDGMNTGVGDDEALKAALVRETNIAYHHSEAIFDALLESQPKSSTSVSQEAISSPPVILSKPRPQGYFSTVSSVVSLLFAVLFAHSVLVFTGVGSQACVTTYMV